MAKKLLMCALLCGVLSGMNVVIAMENKLTVAIHTAEADAGIVASKVKGFFSHQNNVQLSVSKDEKSSVISMSAAEFAGLHRQAAKALKPKSGSDAPTNPVLKIVQNGEEHFVQAEHIIKKVEKKGIQSAATTASEIKQHLDVALGAQTKAHQGHVDSVAEGLKAELAQVATDIKSGDLKKAVDDLTDDFKKSQQQMLPTWLSNIMNMPFIQTYKKHLIGGGTAALFATVMGMLHKYAYIDLSKLNPYKS